MMAEHSRVGIAINVYDKKWKNLHDNFTNVQYNKTYKSERSTSRWGTGIDMRIDMS